MDPASPSPDPPQAREVAAAGDEPALRLAAARLRTLLEGIPQLVWRSVDGGEWTWASPQWTAYTGQAEADSRGLGWLDAVHPDDRARVMAAWRGAAAASRLDVEHRIRRASDGSHRWFTTRSGPVRDGATGARVEWLGTSTDVQDLKELQERQQVLVAELQHRTRNLMGVVRAVMEATLRGSPDPERFAPAFRDRLGALARAQALLSRLGNGERIALDELVRAELSAMGALDAQGRAQGWAERVRLDGPAGVQLRSATVQTFALALHELATNALKHGALAQPGGRLLVRWRVTRGGPGPRLRVEWTESGLAMPSSGMAPRGGSPGGRSGGRSGGRPGAGSLGAGGFGRHLIERALPYQLGAETTYELGPDGVRCTISLPIPPRAD